MSKAEIVLRGKTFSIACAEGQEARLEELGRKLNERLVEMEETIGDVGDTRLLVAAGLSLINLLEEIMFNSDYNLSPATQHINRNPALNGWLSPWQKCECSYRAAIKYR